MNKIIALIIIALFVGCTSLSNMTFDSKYIRQVGDITYDKSIDDPKFELCHGDAFIAQYFHYADGFPATIEKTSLDSLIRSEYKTISKIEETGYIRIRFVVNCQGQAGRYRITESDSNFKPFTFDKRITKQFMQITKGIELWDSISDSKNGGRDYYMYLTFKLEDGVLKEILP